MYFQISWENELPPRFIELVNGELDSSFELVGIFWVIISSHGFWPNQALQSTPKPEFTWRQIWAFGWPLAKPLLP